MSTTSSTIWSTKFPMTQVTQPYYITQRTLYARLNGTVRRLRWLHRILWLTGLRSTKTHTCVTILRICKHNPAETPYCNIIKTTKFPVIQPATANLTLLQNHDEGILPPTTTLIHRTLMKGFWYRRTDGDCVLPEDGKLSILLPSGYRATVPKRSPPS